jgi:hypothetical protein
MEFCDEQNNLTRRRHGVSARAAFCFTVNENRGGRESPEAWSRPIPNMSLVPRGAESRGATERPVWANSEIASQPAPSRVYSGASSRVRVAKETLVMLAFLARA